MSEKYKVDSSLAWKPPEEKELGLKSLNDWLQEYADLLDKFIIKNRPSWEKIFKKNSSLPICGDMIMDMARWLSINPDFILALMLHESGCGTASIFKEKHNPFGWRAYDKAPRESADFFCSTFGAIAFIMYRIRTLYFSESGKYFKGATLKGLNMNYSRDKIEPYDPATWAEKVCAWMNRIDKFLIKERS